MQTIYLDISNNGVVPTVCAKQNDVGRKFAVILTDSGLPYIPVSGSAFSVWYKGASGEGNYTDIGDKPAFYLSGNKVEVEMIVQMLSAHGDGILCLTLNSPDGNQISSWNIPYMCEMVPGSESEKAEEYYTAFSKALEELPYPDETLSISGKAADSAAVGKSLAKKADISYTKKIGNPRNLLDNSDFRNPVNQRRNTSVTEDGLYIIDRWCVNSADNSATVSVDSSGLTITKNNVSYGGIFQNFERYTDMYGKTYTVAICVNGIWECITFAMGKGPGGIEFPVSGLKLYSVESLQVLFRNYSDTPITIQKVALYEGEYTAETLPEYQSKGYGEELAECQRYFLQYNFSDVILPAKMYSGGGSADVSFFLPCTMRLTKPTVSVTASQCQLFANSSNTRCNITEAYLATGNFVGFTAVAESNLDGSAVAVCRIMGKLTLSADL